MAPEITTADRSAYYTAALSLLRFVEARSPSNRRFGSDADALWNGFAGGLRTSDRIDILLRDADGAWPCAFAARAAFGLRAVAEDDAFGANWASLDPMAGEKAWKSALQSSTPATVDEAIESLGTAWDAKAGPASLPALSPSTKLLIGGLSAIAAAVSAFAANDALVWDRQVVVVADAPAERQLAAAAAAILNLTKPTTLRGSDERDRKGLAGFTAVVSDDASAEVRAAIAEITASS
jgi:hypothetical protein